VSAGVKYLAFYPGDMPLVISAPHGGSLEPEYIPFRLTGNPRADLNTQELASEIAGEMGAPFFVAAGIKRSKVDFNRPPEEAINGSPGRNYYDAFHGKLSEYIQLCLDRFGCCFLLDVHGFSTKNYGNHHVIFGTGCYNSLTGNALGQLSRVLINEGWKVLHKHTGYFSGGYIIRQYAGPPVVGLQMEVCKNIRLNSDLRRKFAGYVAEGLKKIIPDSKSSR